METSPVPNDEAKDSTPTPDSKANASTEPTRKPRARRSLDERIEATAKKAAQLRQQRAEQQRKNAERLVHVLGSTLLAMMEQDASLRATWTTQMLEQITRPADRELLHGWLASFPA